MFAVIVFLNFLYFVLSICPNNSFEYKSNCYIYNSTESGFASAEIFCAQLGGHLASIHDAFTNVVIGQQASNYLHESTMSDLWIGATTLLSNGNWNWTDGSDFGFNDWNKGEPQNTSNTNCAAMSLTDEYWTSQDCNKKKPFVCQLSSAPFTTPQPTSTYPLSANCSNGWSYFAPTHSCYGVKAGALTTNWTAAETFCQNNGAHLSSIHSFAEFQHLLSYMYFAWYNLWTGIYSPDSGRTWKTSDGTPSDFLKYGPWCSGYPTNVSGERCLALSADCYFDKDCTTYTLQTLCKKPLFV